MTRPSVATHRSTADLPGRRLRMPVLLGVIAVMFVLGTAPASASAAASIGGTVTDADGHPITSQDVCVVPYDHQAYQQPGLFAPAGVSTITGADGSWSFSSLAPGTYEFLAQDCPDSPRNDVPTFYDPQHTGSAQQVTLADGDAVTGVDIALVPATSISGRVYDGPGTATPIEGICVQASDQGFGQAQAQTDTAGSYVLRHLDPARTYTVSFAPCNISPFVTEYAFWFESYGGAMPTVLSPTVAHPLTGIDGHLTPTLSITGGPAPGSVTDATSVVFHFAANEYATGPDATFLCALDGGPLAACDATYSIAGLAAGVHTLRAQAWAGKLHTPVRTVTWTVNPVTQQNQGDPVHAGAPERSSARAAGRLGQRRVDRSDPQGHAAVQAATARAAAVRVATRALVLGRLQRVCQGNRARVDRAQAEARQAPDTGRHRVRATDLEVEEARPAPLRQGARSHGALRRSADADAADHDDGRRWPLARDDTLAADRARLTAAFQSTFCEHS